ncbi:MAG: NAD-dependent epimerase/dehydratase family protein [Candidatus Eisenbacteria sp.]|nr:NAD-dependent epimerase/dehydratase family protein [Candidatus Eisenbacteria bacterium]
MSIMQNHPPTDANELTRAAPCLITGATGQIGSECVRQLNAAGITPTVLMRRPLPAGGWRGACVEEVTGDLDSVVDGECPPALRRALARTRVLFHLAARVNLAGRGADNMARINSRAALGLFRAAQRAGVERFVQVSSTAAVGCSSIPTAINEDADFNLAQFRNPYFDTKREAEGMLLRAWRDGLAQDRNRRNSAPATELVIVNPSVTIGRNRSFRRLARTRKRRPPPAPGSFLYKLICFWFEGGVNLMDVRDAARGILLAAIHGTPGKRYILAGDNLTTHDLMLHLGRIFGTSGPRIRIPLAFLSASAVLAERWASLTGRRTRLNRTTARLAGPYWFYDASRAREELGFRARPIEETLTDLRDWTLELRESGQQK